MGSCQEKKRKNQNLNKKENANFISLGRKDRRERREDKRGCCLKFIYNLHIFDIIHKLIGNKERYRTSALLSSFAPSASQRLCERSSKITEDT